MGSLNCPGIGAVDGWMERQTAQSSPGKENHGGKVHLPNRHQQEHRPPVSPATAQGLPKSPLDAIVQPLEVSGGFSSVPVQHRHPQVKDYPTGVLGSPPPRCLKGGGDTGWLSKGCSKCDTKYL